MSNFTNNKNPLGRYLDNGRDFELHENVVYHVGNEDSEEVIFIPEGSVTDWASIPDIIRPIISEVYGRKAALVHDYLYRTLGMGGLYDRKRCDEIFLEALIVLSVPLKERTILYTGVRVGGWRAWNKYKKQRQQQLENENNARLDF